MRQKHTYLFILCCLIGIHSIWANPVIIGAEKEVFIPPNQIELLPENGNLLSLDEAQNKPFLKETEWSQSLNSNSTYWGRFEVYNESDQYFEWVFHFSLLLTDIDVYAIDVNNQIAQYKSGFFTPLSKRSFLPIVKGNFVKIPFLKNETKTIYFRAKCERKGMLPIFDVSVTKSDFFYKRLKGSKTFQALFTGFILMMLVYNLFLFFYSSKDRAYIFYSLYLFGVVGYTSYNAGDLADFITPLFHPENPQLIQFSRLVVYIAITSYLTFLRLFLDLKNFMPKWNSIFRWMSYLTLPIAIADATVIQFSNYNFDLADIFSLGWSSIFIFSIFVFSFFLYRTKSKTGYFIVVGTIIMGIGATITIIARLQSAEYSTISFKIGAILEIIIFSLGLAYRRASIEREKTEAFFELEKSRLIEQQNEKEAARLQELDQLKTKLYTNITHEFRTPLTVIMGMNDQIQGFEKEKSLIHRNSSQLLRLINQMLDLSSIESDQMHINWVHGDMVNYLKYLTESFHSMARSKNIQLAFYSEETEVNMDMDEAKIEHLVYNLISNAIKFTPSGGNIVFHVKRIIDRQQAYFLIKIKDDGIGISDQDLPFIFDRFYQSDQHDAMMGTGIGLSLVKEIVDLLNGTIKVQSEINKGSAFTITLPITHNAIQKQSSFASQKNEKNDAHSSDTESIEMDDAKPHLVLIEDHKDVATYIEQILSDQYNIHKCFDGQAGIESVFKIVPDIVISDVMMPKKNGYEVTQILKNDERSSHIPIILLTAKATQNDKLEGLASGADAFLLKPFDKEELLIRIEKLSALRKQMVEKFKQTLPFSEDHGTKPSKIPSLDDQFLEKMTHFINENISNPELSVSNLAEFVSLSNTQVYRKLKALTGMTPTLFIRSIRLRMAMQLLKENHMNVAEAAFQVGFKDPNYFSRVFLAEFGVKASQI